MINIISSSRYKINRKRISAEVESLVKAFGQEAGSVNIVFVGRNKMKQISLKYKKEDVALPVLSFPYKEEKNEMLLGEVLICYPQAVLLAAEREKKVDDIISFLVQHGVENLLNN